jgi:hypothetical protein
MQVFFHEACMHGLQLISHTLLLLISTLRLLQERFGRVHRSTCRDESQLDFGQEQCELVAHSSLEQERADQ